MLAQDERKIARHLALSELGHQRLAHRLDPFAHLAQLCLPQRTQARVAEHRGDHRAAVGRRVGVVGADHALQLAQHPAGLLGAVGDDRQAPDALAVKRERLRKRVRDQELQAGFDEQLHRQAVGLDTAAKALVGEVELCDQVAVGDHRHHLVPLLRAQVDAGRVVAAGVQYDDRAGCGGLQRGQHAGEIDAMRRGVVVRIGDDVEAGGLEQRAVVFPARLADHHRRVGMQSVQQISADLQRAGAAQRLRGDQPAGLAQVGFGTK